MRSMEKKENEKRTTFLINDGGFPLNNDTVDKLWTFVKENFPDGDKYEADIRNNSNVQKASTPVPPSISSAMTIYEKLEEVQTYLNRLQYNHTGMQFFEVRKYRPISGLTEVAKLMIRESLPIKCLEAVILSIYLTSGMQGLDRFTVSFKSKYGRNVHRHVVLGLCYGQNYGAVGLSRRKELMDKPLIYKSLASLILDYKYAYARCNHTLRKVKLSSHIVHDSRSCKKINWKYFTLSVFQMSDEKIKATLDRFSKDMKIL